MSNRSIEASPCPLTIAVVELQLRKLLDGIEPIAKREKKRGSRQVEKPSTLKVINQYYYPGSRSTMEGDSMEHVGRDKLTQTTSGNFTNSAIAWRQELS